MSEPKPVEYAVWSKHLTSKITHELLFSFKQRRFIIPFKHDKNDGKLYYRLLPGNYLKFGLYALKSQDYAKFALTHVYIDQSGKVEEKEIYEAEMSYNAFIKIKYDLNAPFALTEFIRMIPEYHKTAYVDVDERYEMAEDAMSIAMSIMKYLDMKYLERKVTSQ